MAQQSGGKNFYCPNCDQQRPAWVDALRAQPIGEKLEITASCSTCSTVLANATVTQDSWHETTPFDPTAAHRTGG
jgi:hypothetical protein